jgi:sulfite exporter TauE/SafE
MWGPIASILVPGFLMGAAGSLHCMGMCGPLALALPGHRGGMTERMTGVLLYNGGRTLTYATYGGLFGAVAARIGWFGWQQRLSVGFGVLLLLSLVLSGRRVRLFPWLPYRRWMDRLRAQLARQLFDPRPASRFRAGLLNGLLPCGMVYTALAGAALAGSLGAGAAFMAAFGLGTLPAMAGLMLTGGLLRPSLRRELSKVYPLVLALTACLLILRGLNLGIPYLSPTLRWSDSSPAECH